MALDRLTKIDGGGISTTSDYRVGVITATKFVGPIEGSIVSTSATFTGNVSIGGTLTYEDVTNIDSVGIITAQTDVHVGAGLSVVGVTTLTGNILAGGTSIPGYTGADDLTIGNETGGHGITIRSNQSSIGGLFFSYATSPGNNSTQWAGGLEYAHSSGELRFYNGGTVTAMFKSGHLQPWQDSQYDLGTTSKRWRNVLSDHLNLSANATIAGDIDVDGHTNLDNVSIAGITTFPDATATSGRLYFGNDQDMQLWHSGNDGILYSSTGGFYIGGFGTGGITLQANKIRLRNGANNEDMIECTANGAVELYHDNVKRLETSSVGVSIPQDLDVDGHTNLDNVSIAGVTTFSGNTFVNDSFAINDTGSSTPLSITGNFGTGDTVYIQNNTSGGHVKFGLRANDSDGNHHRAYITAERGTGATANGKLSILARRGSGTNFGWIIDAGVGIQANYNVIPETDSTHDLGTSSVRWANVYADTLDIGGNGTFGSNIYLADSIIHSGDTNTSIDYENDKISVKTAGVTRVSVANTGVILDDEVYIRQTSSGMPLRIEGMLGSTENILLKNNTSGGHIQIGFRQNDSDGNHHRAYIKARKSATSGGANGQLELLARHGGGIHGGFIIDRGVGIKANLNIIPETDSAYDLGTSSLRWRDIYTDDLDVDGHTNLDNVSVAGVSTFTGAVTAHDYRSGGGVGNTLYLTSADDWRFRTTGSAERLRITSAGKMGLGISNPIGDFEIFKNSGISSCVVRGPKALLAIMGDTDNTGASETDASIMLTSDAHAILTSPLTAHGYEIALINEEPGSGLRFHDGTYNKERLRINTNGRVGVNTTVTTQQFVSYTEAGYPVLAQGPSNGIGLGNNGAIVFGTKDLGSYAPGILDASTLEFKISGSAKLNINSSGKVGVNVSSFTSGSNKESIMQIKAPTGYAALGIGATTKGIHIGWDGDRSAYDDMRVYRVDYSNAGTYGIAANLPCLVLSPTSAPGSGIVQETVWLKSTGRGSGNAEMNLMVDGDVVIGGDGQVPGGSQSGYPESIVGGRGNSKLTVQPDDNTSAFSASDGDTWHDIVLKQSGGATSNATGIALEVSANAYHKNAGTGIAAIKDGQNTDYGCHLAFITRPHSAIAQERMRIRAAGGFRLNNTDVGEVHSISNSEHGNVEFNHRGGRVLTSNGSGWDGNTSGDGTDPILVLPVANRSGNSDISDAYGLCLHSESQDDNDYGPLIGWSNRSNSGSYNTTYAAIVGQKTGQSVDHNWSAGALHFFTAKPTSGAGGYMTSEADMTVDATGRVLTPRQVSFYATANSGGTVSMTSTHTLTNWRLSTSGKTYSIGGHFNTSNGRFTAPVAGKYLFTASILLAGYDQANSIHMIWRKNGTNYQYWYNTRTSDIDRSGYGGYLAQGSTTTFSLSANDYIDIACDFGGSLSIWAGDQNWGHFSGHLLG